jgi:hypothetical protein
MARWLSVLFAIYLLIPGQVQAKPPEAATPEKSGGPTVGGPPEVKQPEALSVEEKELIISGWYGAGGGYSGSVRLTAKGPGVLPVLFLPSDLKRQKDGKTIDRQAVTADGDIQLSPDTPKNIKITVSGIEEPGTYQGRVQFRPRGGAAGPTLPLTVKVKAAQPLTALPGTDPLKLHLSQGWLAGLLLPKAETVNQRVLQFKNPFQLPVKLTAAEFVLNGEQTSYQLTPPEQVKLEKPAGELHKPVVNLTLDLGRAAIPPDKYSGSIFLKFEGAKEALQVPVVELTMRYGPLRALLFLFIGILLGHFLLYMKTTGLALSKFERDADDLKDRINQTEPVDRVILQRMLDSVEAQVSNKTMKPEEADKEIENIGKRLDLLVGVEAIEQNLPSQGKEPILEKIQAIREAVKQKKDEDGQRLFNELEALLQKQPSVLRTFALVQCPGLQPQAALTPPAQGGKGGPAIWPSLKREWEAIDRFLIKWIGPPIYYAVTLLILLMVGLISLYLKNTTFGAAPVVDYAALVFWGLGSDVASRNIQNVLTAAKL